MTLLGRCTARGLAVLVVTLLGLVLAAGPASAHAVLVGTDPADGAVLDALPAAVTLRFNEEMSSPAYVVVTGPDGEELAEGPAEVDGDQVTQPLRSDTGAGTGTYALALRVVSADGHPVTGQLHFGVGEEPVPTGITGTPEPAAAADGVTPDSAAAPSDPFADEAGYWSRFGVHTVVAVALFTAAGALLLLSRRRAPTHPHSVTRERTGP